MGKKRKSLNSHYDLLKKEWARKHDIAKKTLEEKHKEAFDFLLEKLPAKDKLAGGALALMIISSNVAPTTALAQIAGSPQVQTEDNNSRLEPLIGDLKTIVPESVQPLTSDEEATVSAILSKNFNMSIKPEIAGLRLNRTYGMIGAEQHLTRYPGDTMSSHFTSQNDIDLFYSSGMAPGRGAWGYFANSASEMTVADIEREKWYIAVQTFEAENYNSRVGEYRDFFKYRKILVVNSKTGQAVVADIADAGPAVWTGKHLGGSPEVMYYLGYSQGMRKGPVLYFFIDDPDDTIPLGPISFR